MSQAYPVGILPYSSTDPSILLKCSLRSAAAVAAPVAGPAGAITGTGHSFDADLGYKPAPTGNSVVRFANIPGHLNLDRAGQLSFDIDSYTICAQQSSYASVGYTPGGTEWLMTWDNDSLYGYLRKLNATNIGYKLSNSDTTGASLLLHSQNKGSYSRVTLSWAGSAFDIYVDGYKITPTTATSRVVYTTAQWKNLNILAYITGTGPSRSSYVRDVLLSSKPVSYPMPTVLSSVCVFGHSFANSYSTDNNTTSNLDGQLFHLLRKALGARGYRSHLYSGGIDGGYVDNALIGDSNLHLSTKVAAALLSSPQSIVLLMGTNDCNSASFSSAANFDTSYKAIITAFVTGTNGANIQRIVATTVTSVIGHSTYDTSTIAANRDAVNAKIALLPAWFDATYPTMAGRLKVADLFDKWGGARPTENVMIGQLLGTLVNLHPSPLGNQKQAESIVGRLV